VCLFVSLFLFVCLSANVSVSGVDIALCSFLVVSRVRALPMPLSVCLHILPLFLVLMLHYTIQIVTGVEVIIENFRPECS